MITVKQNVRVQGKVHPEHFLSRGGGGGGLGLCWPAGLLFKMALSERSPPQAQSEILCQHILTTWLKTIFLKCSNILQIVKKTVLFSLIEIESKILAFNGM